MSPVPDPDPQALADLEAIRRLLALYCQLCDDGRFEEWAELFTAEATFTVMGTTHTGRAGLQQFMAEAQPAEARGKHVAVNPLIEVDGNRARAWTDYVFVGRVGEGDRLGVTSSGRYHDDLVRDDDGRWRIAARRIVFLGEPHDDPPPGR